VCVFDLHEAVTWPNMRFTGRLVCVVGKARMRCLIYREKDIGEMDGSMADF
jgi:hypothetical protein